MCHNFWNSINAAYYTAQEQHWKRLLNWFLFLFCRRRLASIRYTILTVVLSWLAVSANFKSLYLRVSERVSLRQLCFLLLDLILFVSGHGLNVETLIGRVEIRNSRIIDNFGNGIKAKFVDGHFIIVDDLLTFCKMANIGKQTFPQLITGIPSFSTDCGRVSWIMFSCFCSGSLFLTGALLRKIWDSGFSFSAFWLSTFLVCHVLFNLHKNYSTIYYNSRFLITVRRRWWLSFLRHITKWLCFCSLYFWPLHIEDLLPGVSWWLAGVGITS